MPFLLRFVYLIYFKLKFSAELKKKQKFRVVNRTRWGAFRKEAVVGFGRDHEADSEKLLLCIATKVNLRKTRAVECWIFGVFLKEEAGSPPL